MADELKEKTKKKKKLLEEHRFSLIVLMIAMCGNIRKASVSFISLKFGTYLYVSIIYSS